MTMDLAGWMRRACREAGKGTGETGPNPLVGALVVRNGTCVGVGHHEKVGQAHAEVFALDDAGRKARGSDLWVTLEPCAHTGRTGPCTERILEAGIKRVFVGTLDPNPRERGTGVRRLRDAGLEVVVGVEELRCRKQNEAYFKFITTGLPFVTVKLGASLDGKLGVGGSHEWVTGPRFQRFVHALRRDHCAVMVGARTVTADDPELTVRLVRPAAHPLRVVVVGNRAPSPSLRVFQGLDVNPTLVVAPAGCSSGNEGALLRGGLGGAGANWLELPPTESGHVPLDAVVAHLGSLGVSRLLVEGGGRLVGAMAQAGLVDRWILAWAPVMVGPAGTAMVELPTPASMGGAKRLRLERWLRLGDDLVGIYRSGPDYTAVLPEGEG